jgi:hypothetical protein
MDAGLSPFHREGRIPPAYLYPVEEDARLDMTTQRRSCRCARCEADYIRQLFELIINAESSGFCDGMWAGMLLS